MAARGSPGGHLSPHPQLCRHSKCQGPIVNKRSARVRTSELRAVLGSCKAAFVGVGAFSGLINILMLTGALFMLEGLRRGLASPQLADAGRSGVPGGISVGLQALLDAVRGRLLVRIGNQVD